jgi:ABC-type polysaccharide/polyol phosphate transport system ATPase subunit
MSDDVLVKVDNVSKRFCRSLKRSLWYGLQDLGSEIGGRRHGGGSGLPQSSADVQLRPDEFWAVKDVSFELRRGECLGLIGRNGAGKTTLLRMLNGLIKPDTGSINTSGRVGALIALGSGFNPILSGRENVYIGGSVVGLDKREINNKIDEIIDFAGIGEFIDAPVQSYSSGMQARLGFAVASSLNQEILLIDEILSVGDTAFREKCYQRLAEMRKKGCSFLFVSHSTLAIELMCDQCLYMVKGTQEFVGRTEQALSMYLKQDEGYATASTKQIFRSPDRDRQQLHKPFISSYSLDRTVAYGGRLLIDTEIIYPSNTDDSFDSLCLYVYISRATDQILDLSLQTSIYRNDATKSIQKASICCDHLIIPPSYYSIKLCLIDKNSKEIVSVTDRMQLRVTSTDIFPADSARDFIIKTFAFKVE